ncbi:MAG: dienelactone hydrolase family protein [Nitrososphaerota archaeon]|nr:dienelactone hydrolase family protein [Nitrososphaerota archaeon]MDG7038181.1 dienelactone hydrolase family protein [Nitrososphaerota archaeon]
MSEELISETTTFSGSNGMNIEGYLVRPKVNERRPAVIVIHEIWGLVDHIKDVADRFAAQGYVVLAPDLYSESRELKSILTADNIRSAWSFMQTLPTNRRADTAFVQSELSKQPPDRREALQKVMSTLFRGGLPKDRLVNHLVKAIDYLNSREYVRQGRVGSVGFCFGGGMSINLACRADLAACTVFYGENPDPIDLVKNINCPVLGLYGGEDDRINGSLDRLVAAMVKYRKTDLEIKIYPGAPHAFFNDSNRTTYREPAARDAWKRVIDFYGRTLMK